METVRGQKVFWKKFSIKVVQRPQKPLPPLKLELRLYRKKWQEIINICGPWFDLPTITYMASKTALPNIFLKIASNQRYEGRYEQ